MIARVDLAVDPAAPVPEPVAEFLRRVDECHDELVRKGGHYAHLASEQAREEAEESPGGGFEPAAGEAP